MLASSTCWGQLLPSFTEESHNKVGVKSTAEVSFMSLLKYIKETSHSRLFRQADGVSKKINQLLRISTTFFNSAELQGTEISFSTSEGCPPSCNSSMLWFCIYKITKVLSTAELFNFKKKDYHDENWPLPVAWSSENQYKYNPRSVNLW